MSLDGIVSDIWKRFQGELFPAIADEVGPLNERHRRLVAVLDLVPVEKHLHYEYCGIGRRPSDRFNALARAFVAKAVWNMAATRDLIDRLNCDPTLRRLCGWSRVSEVPDESTFSRAFAWFAECRLPERMHEALVSTALADTIVGGGVADSPYDPEGVELPALFEAGELESERGLITAMIADLRAELMEALPDFRNGAVAVKHLPAAVDQHDTAGGSRYRRSARRRHGLKLP